MLIKGISSNAYQTTKTNVTLDDDVSLILSVISFFVLLHRAIHLLFVWIYCYSKEVILHQRLYVYDGISETIHRVVDLYL